jgi:sulfur-carrier protein
MAHVKITPHLRHVAPAEPGAYPGATVAEVIDNLCRDHPRLRSYVLDDQGRLRRHIAVFVGGEQLRGAAALAHGVAPSTEVFVFQALSGG